MLIPQNNVGESGKLVRVLVIRAAQFLLDYISYSFYTLFVIELLVIFLMIVTDTGAEKIFIQIVFSTIPLSFWGGKENTIFGARELMTLMAYWSFIIMIVHKTLEKIVKIRIGFGVTFVSFSLFHLFAIIRFWNSSSILLIILFLYIGSLSSYLVYRGINKVSASILKSTYL